MTITMAIVIFLVAVTLGLLIWLEIYSRRRSHQCEHVAQDSDSRTRANWENPPEP
jgi:hypothetical protein